MNHFELNELEKGMKVEFSKTITTQMMSKFKGISGDENPIHVDRDFAQKKGFREVVVYGMLSSIFFSTIVGMYLPGENGLLQSVQCDYLRPVYVDSVLLIKGEIIAIHKSVGQITIKAEVWDEKKELVVRGIIKALVI